MRLFIVPIFCICSVFGAAYTAKTVEQKMSVKVLAIVGIMAALCGICMVRNVKSIYEILKLAICYQVLLATAIIDYKKHKIPNSISGGLLCCGVISRMGELFFETDKFACFLSFLEVALVLFLFYLCYGFLKSHIGAGDLKLLAGIGMLCGIHRLFLLLVISLGIAFVVLGSKFFCRGRFGGQIPLAPVLYAGYFILLFS
jgi:prepilin signal peptidase PulO-like enzyme (type II secretory pathway)